MVVARFRFLSSFPLRFDPKVLNNFRWDASHLCSCWCLLGPDFPPSLGCFRGYAAELWFGCLGWRAPQGARFFLASVAIAFVRLVLHLRGFVANFGKIRKSVCCHEHRSPK